MIKNITVQEASVLALIHSQALSGDFLPSLGSKFLTTFYQGIIQKPGVFSFGFYNDEKIIGYVIGVRDINELFRQALRTRAIYLVFYLIIEVIQKPLLVKNILETFLYPHKDFGPKAELVVIAVLNKYQGQGVGKKLVHQLEKCFTKEGINKYKLSVHADKNAVSFYEHLGFNRVGSFRLYDKMWYLYEKELIQDKH